MKTITDHVRDQLYNDLVAFEALERGVLSLRAYARTIRADVEQLRREKVDVATMTVALSRIEKQLAQTTHIAPQIKLNDLTIQAPLCEVSYPRNELQTHELEALLKLLHSDTKDFVVITQGFREAMIIAPSRYKEDITRTVKAPPSFITDNLFSVTVHFSDEYLAIPNVVYTILKQVAVHKVNIIEVVSTSTELSLIIEKENVETVTSALQKFL